MRIMKKAALFLFVLFLSVCCNVLSVEAAPATQRFSAWVRAEDNQQVFVRINIPNNTKIDGIIVTRAMTSDGYYYFIDNILTEHEGYTIEDETYQYQKNRYEFYDTKNVRPFQRYYYKFQPYQIINNRRVYVGESYSYAYVRSQGPTLYYAEEYNVGGIGLKWTKDSYADGYTITCVKNINSKGEIVEVDLDNISNFRSVGSIANKFKHYAIFNNLMNGVTYSVRIYSYKLENGHRIYSHPSDVMSVTVHKFAHAGETYEEKVQRAFGSYENMEKNFATPELAEKQMTTIKIYVWDYANGKSGPKVTKTQYLTVNKNLAPTIQQIFKEIYYSEEKQVIHAIGGYSYRTGQHMYGLAIDVNPNENYMIDGGQILSGSYWKPDEDPYSIPLECEFVEIMEKYGFTRGFWGDRKDYMHFSYFGT